MSCPINSKPKDLSHGKHGGKSSHIFIEGDKYQTRGEKYQFSGGTYKLNFAKENPGADEACELVAPSFRFCRLFESLPAFRPKDSDLISVASAMIEDPAAALDSKIPAGYTYLGQFIDHDITRDGTIGLPDESLDPDEIIQMRSPSLDLDSLYGGGPLRSPELYQGGILGKRFKIGMTKPSDFGPPAVNQSLPNDLPRRKGGSNPLEAIIADSRNDENLAVAQTHVAFLKFHNAVVETLRPITFGRAREIVENHYQSIVLHDFLPQFVRSETIERVLSKTGDESIFPVRCGDIPCMPVEFSVAAFRMGHTLIRESYEWNAVFNSEEIPATLDLLFTFTGSGGMFGDPSLPTNWIIDWTRFFDFGISGRFFNRTRLIDPLLTPALFNLPEFANLPPSEAFKKALPARNLIRGSRIGLPTGQAIAIHLGLTPLTPSEISSGPDGAIAKQAGFDTNTPLWYYILKEAQIKESGSKLGELGGLLVAEVFIGLIRGTQNSILCKSKWRPEPKLRPSADDCYKMTDLLRFVGDLNPIGED